MGFSAVFIARPVATILLAIGLFLAGGLAYRFLPVAALPSVDIPTIIVFASRPGADPETMANSIAAPLERRLGEIGGVTEITSISAIGYTTIVIQFDLSRDIHSAGSDVMAAINAATADLPSDLPIRPFYKKLNPAEAPVMTLALSSATLSTAKIYDAADTILVQRLSRADGVAQVTINGADKPAIRVRLDPVRLAAAGLASQDVYNAIRGTNVLAPLGSFQTPDTAETIGLNGQISQAEELAPLIIRSSATGTVRLADVAKVVNASADSRVAAWNGTRPAVLLTVFKEAGANVIDTADGVKALMPQLMKWLPPDIQVTVISDRTTTIRASVRDVRTTLLISIALVLLVVLIFMRRLVATVAAAITVPLSICGTLVGMWFLGYTIDNFSLMALTISVGFVVDDAIVMIENIMRLMERGEQPLRAALIGSRQIGFTVMSITLSLVAVFIPLTFMGGILGRLFHEFAMTLTMAILISAVVSLSMTPMICGRFMRSSTHERPHGRLWRLVDAVINGVTRFYVRSLGWALRHQWLPLMVTVLTIVLTVKLYMIVPKGFMPEQDTGILFGSTVADPGISFTAMSDRQRAAVDVILRDPAVESVGSWIGVTAGWNSMNRGWFSVSLKPLAERKVSSDQVIERLREPLERVGGIQTFLFAAQDLRGGGRQGGAEYQYAMITQDVPELRQWALLLEDRMKEIPGLVDVTSDQDRAGPQINVVIDRDAAARLKVNTVAIDNALNNAYAQRQLSTIYTQRNQYKVVLETDPALQADPSMLDRTYVGSTTGLQVPLSQVARFERGTSTLAVRHQGQYPAATISFSLKPGYALGDAQAAVQKATVDLRLPDNVRTEFAGNAQWLQKSLATQPLLIGAGLISIYIVLGVLYESWLHPLTIMSTLPSAGVGALLALLITGTELSIMGIIGIILLMGIVKKNAIMMIDFALEAERQRGVTPLEAIHEACLVRFRPIMMTTLAALFGACPLAFAFGTGAELRQPLGISIIGGLLMSQVLTLYTTPVVWLALERLAGRRKAIVGTAIAE
ncbi:MAG: efflux RND transporter permease subunit [Acetobacteraceae bacterium]